MLKSTIKLIIVLLFCTASGYASNNADIQVSNSSVPTSIRANEKKQVRIRVYNNGTTTWSKNSLFRLGAGSGSNGTQANSVLWKDMDGYAQSLTDARVFLNRNVAPGQSFDFVFNIQAPSNASGSVRLSLRMVQDGVQWFGESYYWNIPVSGTAGGPTNLGRSFPSCSNGSYLVNFSWHNSGSGWWIDVSTDPGFPGNSNTFHKRIDNVTSTNSLNMCVWYNNCNQKLSLRPGVKYYWRLWDGSSHYHGQSFTVPVCNTVQPTNLKVNTPSCVSNGNTYNVDFSWQNNGNGWWLDVSTDPSFPANSSTYHKPINYTTNTNSQNLCIWFHNCNIKLQLRTGYTYYWRIFNGTSHTNGQSFKVEKCSTPPPTNTWRLNIHNNRNLSGSPIATYNWTQGPKGFKYDWGLYGPAGLNDNFSIRFDRRVYFKSGTYTFATQTDDGVRLYVDNSLLINKWQDQATTVHKANKYMSEGWHTIIMHYFEHGGGAYASLDWAKTCPVNLSSDNTSDIAWPFANSMYINSTTGSNNWTVTRGSGTGTHHSGDKHAQDWARTGTCGEEMRAPISGTVIFCGVSNDNIGKEFGNQIIIRSDQNSNFAFRIAHLSRINVQTNQYVVVGKKIGEIGTTGNSTGCHAHAVLYKGLSNDNINTLKIGGWLSSSNNAAPFRFSRNCHDDLGNNLVLRPPVYPILKNAATDMNVTIPEITAKAYPNPVSDEITLELKSTNSEKITVYAINQLGQTVDVPIRNKHLETGINQIRIDVSNYNTGVYTFRIIAGSNTHDLKIIVSQ